MFRFADWKAARTVLRRIESRDRRGLSAIFSFLIAALGSAADPDRSLVNFERFVDSYGPELFPELERTPARDRDPGHDLLCQSVPDRDPAAYPGRPSNS